MHVDRVIIVSNLLHCRSFHWFDANSSGTADVLSLPCYILWVDNTIFGLSSWAVFDLHVFLDRGSWGYFVGVRGAVSHLICLLAPPV